MSSILGIGKSALAAAQAGIATAGHNISNANVAGYSRQEVLQTTAGGQNLGGGYIGRGTVVSDVRRVYSDVLASNVRSSQATQGAVEAYYTQINQINAQLADSDAGLSPTLHEFFKAVQDLASNANAAESRQAVLSDAQALAARFQALDDQMRELSDNVNGQIESSVLDINTYAGQIAKLNDAIEKAQNTGKTPNDLLDQRDQALSELSKQVKVSVVQQGESYNVFIGNGQPLVMGTNTYDLTTMPSSTDRNRIVVGYASGGGGVTEMNEKMLTGGQLGGLLEFRSASLDSARNQLGRVAIGLAMSFNAQHKLGQDLSGAMGTDFFVVGQPAIEAGKANATVPAASIKAVISDPQALTAQDYELLYDGAGYTVTNRSTNEKTSGSFAEATAAIKGVTVSEPDPPMTAGDKFVIKPTVNGATDFAVAIKDTGKIAASAPISSSAPVANTGSGKISAVTMNSSVLVQAAALELTYAGGNMYGFPSDQPVSVTRGGVTTTYPLGTAGVPYADGDQITIGGVTLSGMPAAEGSFAIGRPETTLSYGAGGLSGFPEHMDVTVTHADGTTTSYSGMTPATEIPYTEGDSFSFGGVSVTLTGKPAAGDSFSLGANAIGKGDNRNAVALGALQTAKTMLGGTASYQNAYGQLVSQIGNKTRELEVTNAAETAYLEQAQDNMAAESGVNLDEEATNLMRYQQAYQAAAKVMQTASEMFDALLSISR